MANANGWGDGASNNNIGWGKGADNAIGWGSVYSVSEAGATDIVGTPAVDPDAQAFITAAGITDPTQQSAINTLVTDLKGYNIWTKFQAIYPIVGGTASSHAVNLKTPGTYNMSFGTGVTHSSTGMVSNGTTGYADTFLNVNNILNLNSTHLSYYSRTNVLANAAEIGASGTGQTYLLYNFSSNRFVTINSSFFSAPLLANTTGLLIENRRNATEQQSYKSGSLVNTATVASVQKPNLNVFLLCINSNGAASLISTKQCAFASIGDGLTDTDAANFYTAVQAYQTTLSRNI
jgi:hypothetical protein